MSLALRSCVPVLAAALMLHGCGGSGGSSDSGVRARLTVQWPERARAVAAPGTAQSVRLLLNDPKSPAAPQVLLAERPDTAFATSRTYSFKKGLQPGNYNLLIEFFADDKPSDQLVGRTALPVKVNADGSLSKSDGTPLDSVALEGKVQWVTLPQNQEIVVGTAFKLSMSVWTSDNKLIVPPPSSITFQVTNGSGLVVAADGTVTAQSEGTSTVVATVDEVSSAPQTVTVIGAPLTPRILPVDAVDLVSDAAHGRIYANLREGTGGRVVELDPSAGTIVRGYDLGGEPVAIALAGDASKLYTSTLSAGTVVPISLPNFVAGAPIQLRDAFDNWALHAWDIAVRPGHPDSVAVTTQGSGGFEDLLIYDSGVLGPRTASSHAHGTVAWTSPNRLVVVNLGNPHSYVALTVAPDGPTVENGAVGELSTLSLGFTLAEGRIYDNDLSVWDAGSLTPLGRFGPKPNWAPGPKIYGPVVDSSAKLAYFIEGDAEGGRLHVYRSDDFSFVTTRRITGFPAPVGGEAWRRFRLVRWGKKGLAVPTAGGLILIDNAPGL